MPTPHPKNAAQVTLSRIDGLVSGLSFEVNTMNQANTAQKIDDIMALLVDLAEQAKKWNSGAKIPQGRVSHVDFIIETY